MRPNLNADIRGYRVGQHEPWVSTIGQCSGGWVTTNEKGRFFSNMREDKQLSGFNKKSKPSKKHKGYGHNCVFPGGKSSVFPADVKNAEGRPHNA